MYACLVIGDSTLAFEASRESAVVSTRGQAMVKQAGLADGTAQAQTKTPGGETGLFYQRARAVRAEG
jgi:hypothetical protein